MSHSPWDSPACQCDSSSLWICASTRCLKLTEVCVEQKSHKHNPTYISSNSAVSAVLELLWICSRITKLGSGMMLLLGLWIDLYTYLGCFTPDSLIEVRHCLCFTVRIVSAGDSFYLPNLECEGARILIHPHKDVNAEMEHLPKPSSHFVQGHNLYHLNVKSHL